MPKSNGFFLKKKILMETKNSYLIKAKNAKDEDFNDLYFVNLDGVDLAPKDLDAEILVFRKSEFAVIRADDVQVAELSQKLHHMAAACGHLVRLSGDEVNKDMQESFAPGALIARQTKVEIGAFLESMKSLDIRERVALISSFKTRYHTTSEGAEASLEIKRMFENIAAQRGDISVELYDHGDETEQKSVVVRIEGSKYPDELVLLGSHLDSIAGWWGNSRGSRR